MWCQGVYLVQGGVPGPRGCTWCQGCTWSQGGIPSPQGCTWSQRGASGPREMVYLVPGAVPGPGGVPGPDGVCTWS